jgi:hypothetical protein
MKTTEIVTELKKSHPKLFNKLSDAKAARLISLAMRHAAKQIEDSTESKLKIQGLGAFVIKPADLEKNKAKRINFKAAKVKPKSKAE